jgi:hypothetical protein
MLQDGRHGQLGSSAVSKRRLAELTIQFLVIPHARESIKPGLLRIRLLDEKASGSHGFRKATHGARNRRYPTDLCF